MLQYKSMQVQIKPVVTGLKCYSTIDENPM